MPPKRRPVKALRCSNCVKSRQTCNYTNESESCTRCDLREENCDLRGSQDLYVEPSLSHARESIATPITRAKEAALERYSSVSSPEWREVVLGKRDFGIGADIGTKYSSASWQRVPKHTKIRRGANITTRNIRYNRQHRIPTVAAIQKTPEGLRMIFGGEVEQRLEAGKISEEDVFREPKLALIAKGDIHFQDSNKEIQALHESHQAILSRIEGKKILVQLQHDRSARQVTISSSLDVLKQFLIFLWDLIKADLQSVSSLNTADLEKVLKQAQIGVAAPAVWSEVMNQDFHDLLCEAGWPKPIILWEPKCALADVAECEQQRLAGEEPPGNRITIMADCGHATTVSIDPDVSTS